MSEGADAGEPAARFRCARGWAARAPRPGGAAGSSSRVGPGRALRGAASFLMISVSGPRPATHRRRCPARPPGQRPHLPDGLSRGVGDIRARPVELARCRQLLGPAETPGGAGLLVPPVAAAAPVPTAVRWPGPSRGSPGRVSAELRSAPGVLSRAVCGAGALGRCPGDRVAGLVQTTAQQTLLFPFPGSAEPGGGFAAGRAVLRRSGLAEGALSWVWLISLSVWAAISEFCSFGPLLRGGAPSVSAVSSPRLYLQVQMSKTIKYCSRGWLQEPARPPRASSQQEIRWLWHLLRSEPVCHLLAVAPAAATPESTEGLLRCCWGEPVAQLCPAAPLPDPGLWGISCSWLWVQMCRSGVRELQANTCCCTQVR